jgi:transposase-like protein
MGQKSGPVKEPAEQVVKEIRRATRRQFSAEEKIRIVLSGLRGEDSIAELCRREGIVQNLYYRRSKEFLEAGKKSDRHRPGGLMRTAIQAARDVGPTNYNCYERRDEVFDQCCDERPEGRTHDDGDCEIKDVPRNHKLFEALQHIGLPSLGNTQCDPSISGDARVANRPKPAEPS